MIEITQNRSGCPISSSLEIIGDKWSLLIIRDLFLQRTTFSEFMNSPEKISSNILTNRLNKLLSFNLIEFYRDSKDKKVKKYFLTSAGIDLYPLIYDLSIWSKKHLDIEYNNIALDWYKENFNKTPSQTIFDDVITYESFKELALKHI
ncbi:helix-turn-helix transcriptional regulator [Flavobacteriaceae bacterium]|jgi:DNA-binding HxlR family transcriptional regulator|nr:helix-turn-helix transcriptional regulator [Flavobacteriaceae bacterium]